MICQSTLVNKQTRVKAVNATPGPSAPKVPELMTDIRDTDHMIKGIRCVWILTGDSLIE
jgi:hypothetical protein